MPHVVQCKIDALVDVRSCPSTKGSVSVHSLIPSPYFHSDLCLELMDIGTGYEAGVSAQGKARLWRDSLLQHVDTSLSSSCSVSHASVLLPA